MKQRWRMLSFRVGTLGALALAALALAAVLLIRRDPLAAALLLCCAAGLSLPALRCRIILLKTKSAISCMSPRPANPAPELPV